MRTHHLRDFPYVWIFFAFLALAALFAWAGSWAVAKVVGCIAFLVLVLVLLLRPMNAVYGLMGATGSIKVFFRTFVLITFLFAGIYHLGFFRNAGISYDVNQPHIDFSLYADGEARVPVTVVGELHDTVVVERLIDGESISETTVRHGSQTLVYQPVRFWFTLRNTFLTTLMQEPADFFAVASTWNAGQESDPASALDEQKAAAFQWVLIAQVLISWIFFGVFISLLYSKFRFES